MKKTDIRIIKINKLIKQGLKFKFYQEKYKNYQDLLPIKNFSDFSKLPTINRNDFLNYKPEIKSIYVMQNRKDESGNEPIIPFTKNEFLKMVEYEWLKFKSVGIKNNDVVSIIDFSINHSIPMAVSLINNNIPLVILEGEVEEIYNDIVSKKVTIIFTHIRMLNRILNLAKKNKQKNSHLKLVVTSGETIENLEFTAKEVKKNLGATLVDTVGTRQLCTYAVNNKNSLNYSFIKSEIYAELLEIDKGKKEKEVIITPFWKNDFPLIRFSTGDVVQTFGKASFKKIGYREHNDIKIGSKMFSLEKIYWSTKAAINNQYVFDKFLWKIIPFLNFSIILTKVFNNDVIVVLIERKKSILTLRRKSLISNACKEIVGFPSVVLELTNEEMKEISKNKRYADLRYSQDKKLKNKIHKMLKKVFILN